jgi:hypothetical protein
MTSRGSRGSGNSETKFTTRIDLHVELGQGRVCVIFTPYAASSPIEARDHRGHAYSTWSDSSRPQRTGLSVRVSAESAWGVVIGALGTLRAHYKLP